MRKYQSSLIAMVFWITILWILTSNNVAGWRFIHLDKSINDIKEIISNSETLKAILYTLLKLIEYFIKIIIIATAISILGYKFKIVEELINPLVSIFKSVPVIASILLMFLIFEATNVAFIIVFLMAFPVLYSTFKESLDKIPSSWERHNQVHNVTTFKQVIKMYLPLLLFKNKVMIVSAVGLSLKTLIAAEILTSSTDGVGFQINTARRLYDIDLLFAWIVVLTIIVMLIDLGFKKLVKVGDHNE